MTELKTDPVKSVNRELPVVAVFTKYCTSEFLQNWKRQIDWIPHRVVPVADCSSQDEVLKSLQEAEIILGDCDILEPIFHKLPKTKWIQSTWAGCDPILSIVDPQQPPPITTLTRLGQGLTTSMAEYVIGSLIAHERRFAEIWTQDHKTTTWYQTDYRVLRQLTLGIIGLGDIGKELARLCKPFGMTIWGLVNRDLPMEQRSKNVDVYKQTSSGLAELLAASDYIVNILPETPQTNDILSGDVLSSCTKKPVFINIGRGNVIGDEDIMNALEKGWISHAILDVFKTEPLPETSPLWSSPKVSMTPHIAGITTDTAIIDMMKDNYSRYINGEPLKYKVDWELGY